jgi:hypothetical protein
LFWAQHLKHRKRFSFVAPDRPKDHTAKDQPFQAVLGRKVTIRDQGKEREVTAAEAFLLHLAK